MALEKAGKAELKTLTSFAVDCTYPQFERIRADLSKMDVAPENVEYGAGVRMYFSLGEEELPRAQDRITELSAGSATVEILGNVLRAVPME